MNKALFVLTATALLAASFAGCLGDEAARAEVIVSATDDEYTFIFDGRDSKGDGLSFAWDFGDGTTATDSRVEHTYKFGDGVYKAKLVIEDSAGKTDVWEDEITVGSGQNGAPVAFFQLEKRNYALNETVRVDASPSMDPEGDPLRYRWDFNHLMDFDEYETFRNEKAAAGEEAEGNAGYTFEGEPESFPTPPGYPQGTPGLPREILDKLDPNKLIGHKNGDHGSGGDDGPDPSFFSHIKETEDPVYVLEGGFPDATTFFIRLQVWDIKGDHEEILSEEIWPVEVWEEPPETTARGATKGNFTLGSDEEIVAPYEELGDETLQFQDSFKFEIHWPIAKSTRASNWAPTGFINLTWEAESDENAPEQLASQLEMNITAPNGETVGHQETDGGLRAELDGNNDYTDPESEEKPWRVEIHARQGVNITWDLEYWAKLDTNKFAIYEE